MNRVLRIALCASSVCVLSLLSAVIVRAKSRLMTRPQPKKQQAEKAAADKYEAVAAPASLGWMFESPQAKYRSAMMRVAQSRENRVASRLEARNSPLPVLISSGCRRLFGSPLRTTAKSDRVWRARSRFGHPLPET